LFVGLVLGATVALLLGFCMAVCGSCLPTRRRVADEKVLSLTTNPLPNVTTSVKRAYEIEYNESRVNNETKFHIDMKTLVLLNAVMSRIASVVVVLLRMSGAVRVVPTWFPPSRMGIIGKH
jgi:hypothetical protein